MDELLDDMLKEANRGLWPFMISTVILAVLILIAYQWQQQSEQAATTQACGVFQMKPPETSNEPRRETPFHPLGGLTSFLKDHLPDSLCCLAPDGPPLEQRSDESSHGSSDWSIGQHVLITSKPVGEQIQVDCEPVDTQVPVTTSKHRTFEVTIDPTLTTLPPDMVNEELSLSLDLSLGDGVSPRSIGQRNRLLIAPNASEYETISTESELAEVQTTMPLSTVAENQTGMEFSQVPNGEAPDTRQEGMHQTGRPTLSDNKPVMTEKEEAETCDAVQFANLVADGITEPRLEGSQQQILHKAVDLAENEATIIVGEATNGQVFF